MSERFKDGLVAITIIAAACIGLALIMTACACHRMYLPPPPANERLCPKGMRPQSMTDACDRFTRGGYQCAICLNPKSKGSMPMPGCVDVDDGVYCVASCRDVACASSLDIPVGADGGQ